MVAALVAGLRLGERFCGPPASANGGYACGAIAGLLGGEVLGRVLDKPADFFETVVLDVLLAMGYGGSREVAAQRLGRTGDQGWTA